MSEREWKPGDVGLIPFRGSKAIGLYTIDGWVIPSCPQHAINGYRDVRLLVVIDPEDDEEVERLSEVMCDLAGTDPSDRPATWSVQKALREFANPTPRIEEPTGWGAVVEAAAYTDQIRVFVRTSATSSPWHDDSGNGHNWGELAEVRVLSHGVSPEEAS